ncbi:DUF4412 domain-containing protein [Algoriphagus sp. AGSA1]|uniref:DUF4412 domain-containing protein n=1 Tax=Algoriphagus sp. AGSA1 TaxID=2907213 RepID=UPI001F325780|nr:DUF4412 domain-containing protein [Algoriphagus sp. AGSA1]MCE7056440.1 DUF4412 domain-containing protein [Algoriphagus sp. AGSA1]
MKRYFNSKIYLLCFCLFFMVFEGQSQVLKKLKDQMATKAISGDGQSNEGKGMGGIDLAGMMGQSKDFKAPSEYSFDFQVTMEMNMEKGKPMTQVWKYNVAESYFGMEMSDMLIIYDLDSDVMVTLNPKDKTYTAMSTSMMGMFGNTADDEDDANMPEMKKTNDTKTILGYTATKYIMEDEDLKGEFWMAPEVKFDQAAFAKSLGSYSKKSVPLPEKMQGFMMEMTAFDKKGKVTSHMKVVQLGEIEQVIDMSQYKNGMAF